jgi:hypothetical protein
LGKGSLLASNKLNERFFEPREYVNMSLKSLGEDFPVLWVKEAGMNISLNVMNDSNNKKKKKKKLKKVKIMKENAIVFMR